ncbi:MAG: (2Fe-2S)-binding protein, partial [Victivallales bacterium]|nr:(2Fe-2S)-binding protein [Victivallales bacterium]
MSPVKNTAERAPVSQKGSRITNVDPDALGGKIRANIDGKDITVPMGTTILEAARQLNINIPTLCYHADLCVAGVCRVCVVEVEGQRTLQASCAYPITQPVTVKTHTRKVRQARRHILDLLLSQHYGECYSCSRNNNCELQQLAKEYGVDSFRFGHPDKPRYEKDNSSYAIIRDMDKCILCRRCVRTCIDLQEVGVLEAVGRSNMTEIAAFASKKLSDVICINCGQCINRCPTGALRANDPSDDVWKAIDDPTKHVVIQTAPSPRAGIGEEFGLEPGIPLTFEMNTALRLCGFDKVFDTNFTADLTIIEEGTELILRLYKALMMKDSSIALPQFTSCSPGWVKYIEHFYPEYLAHVSSAKSPQQMFGSVIKTYYAKKFKIDPKDIVTVALMPCSAKKFECNRPEMCDSGFKDIDYGLTTRELAQMIRETGIDLPKMEKSDFDDPFGSATGSGIIFGATGGVMEAALRTVFELVTGQVADPDVLAGQVSEIRGFEGIKYKELTLPKKLGPVPELLKMNKKVPFKNWDWLSGATLKLAVCHGTANAKKVMEDIKAGGKFS